MALVLFMLSLSSSQRTLLLEIPVKYVTLWVSYQLSRTILRSLSKEWWTWMPVKHLWETQTDSLGGHSPAKQDSCSVGVCSNCTEQQGQSSVGSCHQPLWSQGHSHSVINTGSSHFLKWLHLETISGSLLPFHHETRTCNRFFPWSGFFPPYSLFLDILSTRAILQGIREDGYICGVWICYICVLSL